MDVREITHWICLAQYRVKIFVSLCAATRKFECRRWRGFHWL